MSEAAFFDVLREALQIAVRISAPMLFMALLTGVVIGLFQALTSVQEMTLTFVPKLAAMLIAFWASMGFMTSALTSFYADTLIVLIQGAS